MNIDSIQFFSFIVVESEAHTLTKPLKSDEEVFPDHYALYWWHQKAAN